MAKRKNETFADRARKIMKKYEPRLGKDFDGIDKPAREAMEKELDELRQEQEEVRAKKGVKKETQSGLPVMREGGPSQFLNDFWNKTLGMRKLDSLTNELYDYNPYDGASSFWSQDYINSLFPSRSPEQQIIIDPENTRNLIARIPEIPVTDQPVSQSQDRTRTRVPGSDEKLALIEGIEFPIPEINTETLPATNVSPTGTVEDASTTYTGKKLKPYQSVVSLLPLLTSLTGAALLNRQANLIAQRDYDITPPKVMPHLISLAQEREQAKRDAALREAQIRHGIESQGGSAGQKTNRLLAGITGLQRNLGNIYGSSIQREGLANQQAKTRADQFNAQSRLRADLYNQRTDLQNQMYADRTRSNAINSVMSSIQGYASDLNRARQYDNMLQMMGAYGNYGTYIDPKYSDKPGIIRVLRELLGIQKPMDIQLYKTDSI